jgi:hypothetical protein
MVEKKISRRGFLKGSATLAGMLAFAGGPIALLAPSRAWALELKALSAPEGQALLRFTRHLFPHDRLEDAVYALVVKDLDTAASNDPNIRKLLRSGIAELDQKAGGRWLDLNSEHQVTIVKGLQSSPFFEKVRSTAIVSLYDNDMAYAHFGYPGASFNKGGYLHRGFNDLSWLPNPTEAASPAPR